MRLLIISVFISIISLNANAQSLFNYGIKLGANVTDQSWDYKYSGTMKWDNITTVSPRLFAEIYLSSMQIEGEFGYARKGFETSIPITTVGNPDGTGEKIINNQLNYLNISLAGKYTYSMGIFAPYLIAGPQLNILLNMDTDMSFYSIFDNYKNANLGATLGLGTEIRQVLPFALLIEYRYERDLFNNYRSGNIDIRNYSHVILVGIKL